MVAAVSVPATNPTAVQGASYLPVKESSERSEKRKNGSSALDDVAASAARLVSRQRKHFSDEVCVLDAIPHLSRPLEQLRQDTTAAVVGHPSPAPTAVHAPAVRLLASAPGFEADRLRRAVNDFGELTQHPERAARSAAASGGVSWLDDPGFVPEEDFSVSSLQLRHRNAINAHAADHLRLDASLAFRNAFREALQLDLLSSRVSLSATLRAAVDLSVAIPSPFVDICPYTETSLSTPVASSGAALSSASAGKTPSRSSRPPRPITGSGRTSSVAQGPSEEHGVNQSSRRSGGVQGQALTPTHIGTPTARNVLSAEPDVDFISVVRERALDLDTPSEISLQLLSHARARGDHPHFIACLSVLADLSHVASLRSNADDHVRSRASRAPDVTFDDLVCSSRNMLESFFGHIMGTIPLDRDMRSPSSVLNGVRNFVHQKLRSGTLYPTTLDRESGQGQGPVFAGNLPLWPQLFYCLRCGSPSAALELADDAHEILDEDGSHFRFYLHEFLRQGQTIEAKFASEDLSRRTQKRSDVSSEEEGDAEEIAVNDGFGESDGDDNLRPLRVSDSYMAHSVPGSIVELSHYQSLVDEYETSVYYSNDPYRRACYALVARLDISPPANSGGTSASSGSRVHSSHRKPLNSRSAPNDDVKRLNLRLRDEDYRLMFGATEDYLWLRLWLCRTSHEDFFLKELGATVSTADVLQVQNEIMSFGHSHFDAQGTQPLLYALMLICVGLPWDAVEYLAAQNSPQLSAYAAYLALPLYAMGWTTDETKYASVVWAYVIHFACDFPKEAALCLFTLRDRNILGKCIQRLVGDTRKFAELLGDGRNSQGCLMEVASDLRDAGCAGDVDIVAFVDSLRKELAETLAREYSARSIAGSSSSDAAALALLYAIAGDKHREQHVLLTDLAAHVAVQESGVAREQSLRAARLFMDSEDTETLLSAMLHRSFTVLLNMADFFDDYWKGENAWESAWAKLESMGVLPFEKERIRECQLNLTASSGHFSPLVLGKLADVVRAALVISEALLNVEDRHAGACREGPKPSNVVALITFAGLMGLSETEINSRLVRLELMLEN